MRVQLAATRITTRSENRLSPLSSDERSVRSDDEPDAAWFTRILAGAPPPEGVRADPTDAEPAATLCTFVADLTEGEASVLSLGGAPVTIPLDDLARGNAGPWRPGP